MEVAVLRPADCLKRNNHHHHHRRKVIHPANKPRRSSNPNPNTDANRSSRRRRNSQPPPPLSGPTKAQNPLPKSPPVMGQVRILKRGENLDLCPPKKPQPSERHEFGPLLDGFYAGSAFVASPPPSSVPLPAFLRRETAVRLRVNSRKY